MRNESKPTNLPEVFSFEAEPNSWLKRYKETRISKWKPTANGLKQMSELAVLLLSLERWSEVQQLGEFVSANCSFQGGFNIWTWASLTLELASYAMRRAHQQDIADAFHRSAYPLPNFTTGIKFVPLDDWAREFEKPYSSREWPHLMGLIRSNINILEAAVRGVPTAPMNVTLADADVREALSRLRVILEGK